MDRETERRIETLLSDRHESWCYVPPVGWMVVNDGQRDSSTAGTVLVNVPERNAYTELAVQQWSIAKDRFGWISQCRANQRLGEEFQRVLMAWHARLGGEEPARSEQSERQRSEDELELRIEKIMVNHHESWCCMPEAGWAAIDYSEPRTVAGKRLVHLLEKDQSIELCESEWVEVEARCSWKSQWRVSQETKEGFLRIFKSWREQKREANREWQEEKEACRKLLAELMEAIPRFSVSDRHRLYTQIFGGRYRGVRSPEENARERNHRKTWCWNCHRFLDNYEELECRSCGWILCRCGACGCGSVEHIHACPVCGLGFRAPDSFGNYPFCSVGCRLSVLKDYAEYLKSDEWHSRRGLCLIRDNGTCQDCGKQASHVHHLTYERVGQEHVDDLVSLCDACHAIRHAAAIRRHEAAEILHAMKRLTDS